MALFRFLQCLVFSTVVAIIWMACDPLPCLETKTAQLRMEFVRDSAQFVLPTKFEVDSVYQWVNGQKRKIVSAPTSLTEIAISFPPNADSLQWQTFDSLGNDQFGFIYQTRPKYVSDECGYRPVFDLKKVRFESSGRIKTIRILHNAIDTTKKTHVQVVLFD